MTSHTPAASHPWRGSYKQDTRRVTERTCRVCGETKPIEQFPRSGDFGRRSACSPCYNTERRENPEERERKRLRMKAYYHANPQRKIDANRRQRHRKMAAAGHPPATAPDRWWSTIRAAMEMGRSESYVVRACREGRLRAVKAINQRYGGYCWRIDPTSVAEYKKGRG